MRAVLRMGLVVVMACAASAAATAGEPGAFPAERAAAVIAQAGAPTEPAENSDAAGKEKESVIQSLDLPVRPAIARAVKSTWENGYGDVRSAIAALQAEAQRLGLAADGRPLVIYIESDDSGFRADVLLPLAKQPSADVELSDGVRIAHNPGGKAMKFEHRGAYAEIENTYQAITAYLDEKALTARDFLVEEFVNDAADAGDIKMAVNIYVFLR